MKKLKISSFIFLMMCYKMIAQTDSYNVEHGKTLTFAYEQLPSLGNLQLQSKTFKFGSVDSLAMGNFQYGLTYSNVNLFYKDYDSVELLDSSLETLHKIGFHIGHQFNLKNNWNFFIAINPVIFSNLESSVSSEDLVINGNVAIHKEWMLDDTLKQGLELGLGYGAALGQPRIFPMVSYYREVSDAFSFKIGFPKTEMNYTIDKKSRLSLAFSKEGFYANNSSLVPLNTRNYYTNTKLVYSSFKTNLNYSLKMSETFSSSMNIGYLPKTDLKVMDEHGSELYNYNSNESVTFGVGLKYNF